MRIVAPIPKKILLVGQNSREKNKLFCARRFYTLYEQKCSNLRPLLFITFSQGFWTSKKFGHWTSENGGKNMFKRSEQMKRHVKNFFCHGDFRPFLSKNFQICDHFFPLLFQGFRISKKFRHWTLGSGGKRTVKRSEKVWQTDKHTERYGDL